MSIKHKIIIYILATLLLSSCKEDPCENAIQFRDDTFFLVGEWSLIYVVETQFNSATGSYSYDTISSIQPQFKVVFESYGTVIIKNGNQELNRECVKLFNKNIYDDDGVNTIDIDLASLESNKELTVVKKDTTEIILVTNRRFDFPYKAYESNGISYGYLFYFKNQ